MQLYVGHVTDFTAVKSVIACTTPSVAEIMYCYVGVTYQYMGSVAVRLKIRDIQLFRTLRSAPASYSYWQAICELSEI